MNFFKNNNTGFFKSIYLLLILCILDFSFVYATLSSSTFINSVETLAAILAINFLFIYLNWDIIITIYRAIKNNQLKKAFSRSLKYNTSNKSTGIFRVIQIIMGGVLIVWSIFSDIDIILRFVVILMGMYNLWRSI
ncbi:hypothetical protein [Veillonella caviae]|uniref:hypothetical protein n=1 Tax=Veillonella caviae TaxID=248316 RepID=UPI0023F76FE9|nr:hypothetical protein [Veillonella caviae]MCI7694343.1 hypothetical protein [Veillonella caviae]MDY4746562.1 hypothetical protein [Veillonella caviae]